MAGSVGPGRFGSLGLDLDLDLDLVPAPASVLVLDPDPTPDPGRVRPGRPCPRWRPAGRIAGAASGCCAR
ncbi:hypothetical protein ACFZBU_16045 [Embleya sp. NPDC008237]|uniref:hypothetical protein n=1 Tax=Embleya sp. NPDC008237 TaxID=3363978 RepID=UPI0036EA9ADA